MSGDDFFTKPTKGEPNVSFPVVGPAPNPDAGDQGGTQQSIDVADMSTHRLLEHILRELRAIHWHLATMTDHNPDEIRRDV